jgi:hypothetical protein
MGVWLSAVRIRRTLVIHQGQTLAVDRNAVIKWPGAGAEDSQ